MHSKLPILARRITASHPACIEQKNNDFQTSMNLKKNQRALRNEFHFSGVHGAMNRSGSRAK